MKYDFDNELNRFNTYSMKWGDSDFFQTVAPGIHLDDDTIRLMVADMDFRCAPAIVEAMHRVADHANFGYTSIGAAPEYYQAIIHWYRRRYSFDIPQEWIVYSSGALDGVGRTIAAFSQPGDGVIVCWPAYSSFMGTIMKLGRRVVNCQKLLNGQGKYQMDWEKFEQLCAQEENKVFILCSPENPVGRIWTKDELARMAAICQKNGVVLVSDEIHSDFIRAGEKHIPILQAVEDHRNLVMVSGANKSFNLMGLHCAYSIIPDEDLRRRFLDGYSPNMPTPFAIAAMVAAYNEGEDWLNELNAYLDEELAFAVEYMKEKLPKAKAYVPQATYFLWVDFSEYGYSQEVLQSLVNHRANVAVHFGPAHDPDEGEHYLRICLTCSKATLKEAIDRIAAVFAEYEAEQNGK